MSSAAMEQVGETPPLPEGSVIWFADKRFTQPGLYVSDGKRNHLVVELSTLAIAMSDPDVSDEVEAENTAALGVTEAE